MNEYINKTTIIFNESFKALVQEIRHLNPDDCINGLKDSIASEANILILLASQKYIRNWFSSRIKIGKGCKSLPDYYAILNAVITDINICYSWDDVFKQVIESHKSCVSYIRCDGDDDRYFNKYQCICGQTCGRNSLSITTNIHTKLNCLTACECITKMGIISTSQYKRGALIAGRERGLKNEFIRGKFINFIFKYVCIRDRFRKCNDCLCYVILKLEPSWKRKCLPCWKQGK